MVRKKKQKGRGPSKRGVNKNKKTTNKESKLKKHIASEVESDTLKAVLGVLLLTFAVIFFMAPFSLAGKFGQWIYSLGHKLLGFGYYLLPVSLAIASFAIYKTREKKTGLLRSFALLLFFVSALSLLEIFFTGAGGALGELIVKPTLWAFDKVAGSLLLFALGAAGLFVAFDTHPIKMFANWKAKREQDEFEDSALGDTEQEKIEKVIQKAQERKQEEEPEQKQEKKTAKIVDSIKKVADKATQGIEISVATPDTKNYKLPPISILKKDKGRPSVGDVKANANRIKQTLANFGIVVEMDEITIGPTVTRYAMKPAEGVRLNKILSLQSNLELALAASPIRIEAPIPGKSLVGIEVPNTGKTTLGLASLIGNSEFYSDKFLLPLALGKDITGAPQYADLAKAPHMLIAGATGAGKSVTIHDLLISLLYKYGPDKLRLILVDPKRVELTLYNGIPHLLTPVIVDAKKTILTLKWLISEMERRYDILEAHKVQNLKDYHKQVVEKAAAKGVDEDEMPEGLPFIVTVLDELADIMQLYPKELESAIVRIAQKARAVGIHLILATQRPDVRTITGLIKANVPTRIALQVPSQIDSRTILDQSGAEKLLGAGDMLFLSGSMQKPKRIQAPFVSTAEIKELVKYISKNFEGELQDEIDLDSVGSDTVAFSSGNLLEDDDERNSEEYKAAVEFVISAKKASTSLLQRKFRIGYNKAARFIDMMEEDGLIGPQNGSKPREVLVDSLEANAEGADAQEDNEQEHSPALINDTDETKNTSQEYDDTDNETTIRYNNE